MPGELAKDSEPVAEARPRRGKVLIVAALVIISAGLGAAPRTPQSVLAIYRNSVGAGNRLLNPPPPALPQAVAMHDSFGQSGDEYKLPVPTNIPDATTDPSQIRVLPVIDPTAKPQKNSDANSGSEQALSADNTSVNQPPMMPNQTAQRPFEQHEVREAVPTSVGDAPRSPTDTRSDAIPAKTESISHH